MRGLNDVSLNNWRIRTAVGMEYAQSSAPPTTGGDRDTRALCVAQVLYEEEKRDAEDTPLSNKSRRSSHGCRVVLYIAMLYASLVGLTRFIRFSVCSLCCRCVRAYLICIFISWKHSTALSGPRLVALYSKESSEMRC